MIRDVLSHRDSPRHKRRHERQWNRSVSLNKALEMRISHHWTTTFEYLPESKRVWEWSEVIDTDGTSEGLDPGVAELARRRGHIRCVARFGDSGLWRVSRRLRRYVEEHALRRGDDPEAVGSGLPRLQSVFGPVNGVEKVADVESEVERRRREARFTVEVREAGGVSKQLTIFEATA